jgi:hypothetical protein
MHLNSLIRHPGQSEEAIRCPEDSMSYWIADNSCTVSGATMKCYRDSSERWLILIATGPEMVVGLYSG